MFNVHTYPAHKSLSSSVKCLQHLIRGVLQLNEQLSVDCSQRQCVCVSVCPHVSHTCLAQQLQQGGPATLSDLQRVLDDAEEVVQETKAHLQQRALSVKCHVQFVRQGICWKFFAFFPPLFLLNDSIYRTMQLYPKIIIVLKNKKQK